MPWYETLGLRAEGGDSSLRFEEVDSVLVDSSLFNGGLHASNASILIPVLRQFKSLISAVQSASSMSKEMEELVQYCVGATRCLLEVKRQEVMPPKVIMASGGLKSEMGNVCAFVQAHGTQKACCGKVVLNARDRASAEKYKLKLRDLLDALFAGLAEQHHQQADAEAQAARRLLTFVSHAGEDKPFVRSLLTAIEQFKVPAFFDDDMALGTSSEQEMASVAEEADKAIVVLSRPFLTKEWPMKELHIFLENDCAIYPLYYKITPDEFQTEIVDAYDRREFSVFRQKGIGRS